MKIPKPTEADKDYFRSVRSPTDRKCEKTVVGLSSLVSSGTNSRTGDFYSG